MRMSHGWWWFWAGLAGTEKSIHTNQYTDWHRADQHRQYKLTLMPITIHTHLKSCPQSHKGLTDDHQFMRLYHDTLWLWSIWQHVDVKGLGFSSLVELFQPSAVTPSGVRIDILSIYITMIVNSDTSATVNVCCQLAVIEKSCLKTRETSARQSKHTYNVELTHWGSD